MMQINLLDHGYVRLVLSYGSDEDVIEDARQSTDKGFLGWDPVPCPICKGVGCRDCNGTGMTKGDAALLKFLYSHNHLTPFEGSGMKIEVKAPIMVFREWHRHRTQSYNEMSGRYIEIPNEHYVPSINRLIESALQSLTSINKQLQSAYSIESINELWAETIQAKIIAVQKIHQESYEDLLASGVPKELGRINMPVSRYSKMRATANLRNWLAFLTLRDDPAAQWEIRQYAKAVSAIIIEKFPRTHALYVEHKGR